METPHLNFDRLERLVVAADSRHLQGYFVGCRRGSVRAMPSPSPRALPSFSYGNRRPREIRDVRVGVPGAGVTEDHRAGTLSAFGTKQGTKAV